MTCFLEDLLNRIDECQIVVNVKFRKLEPICILPRQYVETRWNSDYQMVFDSLQMIFVMFVVMPILLIHITYFSSSKVLRN